MEIKKVAILGYRSVNVYAVILAAIFANQTYVPLNPRFPEKRTIEMILDSDVDAIIVCKECAAYLKKLLKEAKILISLTNRIFQKKDLTI